MKKCVVIGGGVIGLNSAYFLAKAGHEVVLIDKSDLSGGCSYGNAGMIVPSHVVPLAQPGMISKGVRWMMNSESPFYVKPRLSLDLLKWGWSFYKHANEKHVEKSKQPLLELSLLSKSLFQDFHQTTKVFEYQEKGLLMLYKTDKVGEEEIKAGELARSMNLNVQFLSPKEIAKLEQSISTTAIGAVYYENDAHLSPNKFMSFLKKEVADLGVKLMSNSKVKSVQKKNGLVESITVDDQIISADEFVLAAGSWNPEISQMFDQKLKILPGKGYSFNISSESQAPSIPSILCEGKVAVTPMNNQVRFGGTMEITHTKDNSINQGRLRGVVDCAKRFYPEIAMSLNDLGDVWSGFRPCSSTGLPIISRSSKHHNVIIAGGHGMMGLSLGPATGKVVQELISEDKLSVNLDSFKIVW